MNQFGGNSNNQQQQQSQQQQRSRNPTVRNRYGKPELETKQEYAADLERQIAEKNERKNREKSDRRQPEGGFLGMGHQQSPIPPINNNNRNGGGGGGGYRYTDDASNDGYESTNSNAQKQSRYLRELDEQIRIKKEMRQKEQQQSMHQGGNSAYYQQQQGGGQQPPPQNIYMADMSDSKGSRKQVFMRHC